MGSQGPLEQICQKVRSRLLAAVEAGVAALALLGGFSADAALRGGVPEGWARRVVGNGACA
jgi:hypothetical protein